MNEAKEKRVKYRYKKKKKYSRKKQKRILKWKKAGHQMFSLAIVLFIMPFFYFLIWGLLIEPQLPRHVYGPGDFKEMIYVFISLFIILFSYLMVRLINYKPLNMAWWENMKLLHSVNYNLEKYISYKEMGINYSHQRKKLLSQKRKKLQSQKRKKSNHYHKSITEK